MKQKQPDTVLNCHLMMYTCCLLNFPSKRNIGGDLTEFRVSRVALNFCGTLFLRIGDFLCFAGTNFCDWEKLVFLSGN